MHEHTHYLLTLKDRTRYELAEDGAVLYRTDQSSPRGTWDYSGEWIILGFATRHNSNRIISLEAAANGADIGQGWVHDLDHGTYRVWGSPTGHRAATIRRRYEQLVLPLAA